MMRYAEAIGILALGIIFSVLAIFLAPMAVLAKSVIMAVNTVQRDF